ncbi:MAG: hypothetical protein U0931_25525 [Vulcanimicrobiota bacterium]
MKSSCLWLGLVALARAYEAPQIWMVDGASLAYSRAQIEEKLGRSTWDRPLKATIGGETWEYTYANGLKVDFRDRDRGRHALLLVGKRVTSRGLPLLRAGLTRARLIEAMGAPPLAEDGDQVVYYDADRLAYLTAYFENDRAQEFVLSRFRVDK